MYPKLYRKIKIDLPYLLVKNISLYDLQNLLIPNNTVVMKGGDFNTTEDQFVRVLFEEYSATQEDKRPGKELSEDQCKSNFPQSICEHKFTIKILDIAITHLIVLILTWLDHF